ncbi:MAG TPA: protein phosphatase 2C domain-containing protein [Bryobacteraceae bacterium]|nr:protein phosphatase 2C domain-containing protein [Bryobacteraceae bacterium]
MMSIDCKWRAGAATDCGLVRAENQDRSWVDEERGVFLVVDGLGGHAAGEKAAETAVEVIRAELLKDQGGLEQRIRNAITAANNRICDLASENAAWSGMACVLTLAVMDGERVVVGHVGDSRLYLVWNGVLRKITADHSPVGEREDCGELTEEQAMSHPRRHEVFRDVGSRRREPDQDEFIEIKEFLFKPDAALLLCSDGLSDQLTSEAMVEIIERYDHDPEAVARSLVEAANAAGGADNVTAIFVAGSEFAGILSPAMSGARARHRITRDRSESVVTAAATPAGVSRAVRVMTCRTAFLIYGFILGVVLALALRS